MNSRDLAGAFLSALTQTNRPIRLRLAGERKLLDDVLLVKRVVGNESMCGGLEYRLQCVSAESGLALKDFIALPIELQLVTDRGELRSVCGVVTHAFAGQSDGGLATYQLVARDALAIMEQRVNTRVFRNKNEVDVALAILDEWKQTNAVLAKAFDVDTAQLRGSYPAREFIMQHNESDAAFLRRLWKRQGIAWFMRPGRASQDDSNDMPAHTLVLFDDATGLAQNSAGIVRYHRDHATESRDSITTWTAMRSLKPGGVTRHSWDYASVRLMETQALTTMQQGPMGDQLAAGIDEYVVDVPHAGDDMKDYRRLGDLRMRRHEYEAKCFHGESGVRDLCVGEWIGLSGHPEIDTHPSDERQFVITELSVLADSNLPKAVDEKIQRLFSANGWQTELSTSTLLKANEEREVRYSNRFTCVRRGIPIVPSFDPRTDLPVATLQSALVVGPDGEEVHCDTMGRVKIRFPATRQQDHAGAGASDTDSDSAWVRVVSTWAGGQRGAFTLPRVGDEVIVDFLGGDPDKPLIVGQVYNGAALPPKFNHTGTLPENRYLSGIKSKEVQGGRLNQLRLDDTPEQISAQLASEHGYSELNLGWLTHPRQGGKARPRGEGAELRSDNSVVIRSAQMLLLTTQAMLRAQGDQLERGMLQGLLESSQALLKELGEFAEQNQAMAVDQEPHKDLNENLRNAEKGTNTQSGGEVDTASPLIAQYAHGGFLSATPYSSVSYSGQQHNVIAQQNIQAVAGERVNINARQGISLFSQKNGMKYIAHTGKVDIQAQHDSIGIAAGNDMTITASEGEITIAAQKSISLICGGAYIKIADGKIELGCSGDFTVKAGMHKWDGPGRMSFDLPHFSGEGKPPAQWIGLDYRDADTGEGVDGAEYEIHFDKGPVLNGTLDANGKTRRENVANKPVKKVIYKPRTAGTDKPAAPLSDLLQE
ncbi:type VI secretion system Vgr family protein [Massilia sp. CT11-108]|uniref:type VI secretion system Vgr family protein n=1 Tax=Massilia sp. CT11-108 TaxID=3393900 RepID=UPI0039A66CD1